MEKELEDMIKDINYILSDDDYDDETKKLKESMVSYVYANYLSDNDREIYETSLNLFARENCDSYVLSILTMSYPAYEIETVESILDNHSKLYYPFIITKEIIWTISKILNIDIETVRQECKKWEIKNNLVV